MFKKGKRYRTTVSQGLVCSFPYQCIWKRLIYLVIINIYFFVHAWGSMRNQEFHKGVHALKSLGTPALEDGDVAFSILKVSCKAVLKLYL